MPRLKYVVRFVVLIALLLAIPVSVALAGTLAQTSDQPTVQILLPAPESIDPTQLSRFDLTGRDVAENLFVGLTRINPITSAVEPGLAESWSVSEDGLTWTFMLRDDIQWVRMSPESDQITTVRQVVAGDFVYAIQRGCNPLQPSPYTANLMVVAGCQTVRDAFTEVITDIFVARELGIRATSPRTLEIDLLFPTSYFLTLVSTPEFRPLARESVSKGDDWTAPESILTNGPFALHSQSATGMTLVQNPFWPDNSEGNVTQVDITFTNEGLDPASALSGNTVDLARLADNQVQLAASAAPDLLETNNGSGMVMLGYSYERALVDQPDYRRALAQAIDRNALVERFWPHQATPANQLSPLSAIAGETAQSTIFDPVAAQQSLAAAGFPNCDGISEPVILLVPNDNSVWAEIGQFIIEQWTQNLGCNPALFEVRTLSRPLMIEIAHSTYDAELVTRSHVWLTTWSVDYPDSNAWLSDALHCRYGFIRGGRPCDISDSLLDEAAITLDSDARAAMYTQVESNFFGPRGSFPVSPLYFTTDAWLQQPWLSNINLDEAARFDQWVIDTSRAE